MAQAERPERVTHEPQATGPKRKMKDVMKQLPSKIVTNMKANKKLKECCQNAEEHMIQGFKSSPEREGADLLIMECNCGRKHHTMAAGAGALG